VAFEGLRVALGLFYMDFTVKLKVLGYEKFDTRNFVPIQLKITSYTTIFQKRLPVRPLF